MIRLVRAGGGQPDKILVNPNDVAIFGDHLDGIPVEPDERVPRSEAWAVQDREREDRALYG